MSDGDYKHAPRVCCTHNMKYLGEYDDVCCIIDGIQFIMNIHGSF